MKVQSSSDIIKLISAAIYRRRMALGRSQEEVAETAGLSRTYYSDIERAVRNMSVVSLFNIARALDTSAVVLMQEAETERENR
jgi:transcriptional regulator with XRE-family HTH domain